MSRKNDSRLRKIAATAYERVRDRNAGRVDLDEVVTEVETELEAEGLAADLLHDIAKEFAEAEDRVRCSRSTSGQLDLLTGEDESLDGMWRLGGRLRVQVRHAKRTEYLAHLAAQGDNASRVTAAYAKAQREAAELLPYMVDDSVTVEQARAAWRAARPSDGAR